MSHFSVRKSAGVLMRVLFLILFFVSFCGAKSSAAVVLTIDITDLSKVKFTGTTALAQNNETDMRTLDGIVLVGLFSKNPVSNNVPASTSSSSLRSTGGSSALKEFYTGGYAGNVLNLNLAGTDLTTHDFSTSQRAFTGSALANFSSVAAGSLVVGKTGDIWSGSALDSKVVIGQFLIIPEPGMPILVLVGFGMMALGRRR